MQLQILFPDYVGKVYDYAVGYFDRRIRWFAEQAVKRSPSPSFGRRGQRRANKAGLKTEAANLSINTDIATPKTRTPKLST